MEGFNGSYMFESLSSYLGIPLDQVNFIMVQVFGIIFGNFFRRSLPRNKIGTNGRHLVEFVIGFSMLFFCFGSRAYILFFQMAIVYLLMLTLPQSCGILSLVSSMCILAVWHWKRLYYDPTIYITVDITGPMMINTQRLTSLAFGISDGWKKKNKDSKIIIKNINNNIYKHNDENNKRVHESNNQNNAHNVQQKDHSNHYNHHTNHINNHNNNSNVDGINSSLDNVNVYKNGLPNGQVPYGDLRNGNLIKNNLIINEINHIHEHTMNNNNDNNNNNINNNNHDTNYIENQFLLSRAVDKVPSVLKLLSYTYCFHMVICGPFCYYHDYINFIEENNPTKKADGTADNGFSYRQLDPKWNILRNMCGAFILIILSLLFAPFSNMLTLTDESFIRSLGPLKICFYLLVISHVAKFKYYVAWKLADAMNSSVGLAFNGWDGEGREKWDLTKNVDVLKVETASNLQEVFKHWNKTTSTWLRYIVYERTRSTYLVFMLSAVWHGFFPGYYISFISGAFCISVSRMARKLIRPFMVTDSKRSSLPYDVITIAITKIQLAYLGSAFMLLDFHKTVKFYSEIYFIIHIINIIAFVLLLTITKRLQNKRK